MYEVKVYKPNLGKLVLDHIISVKKLIDRGDVLIRKISRSPHDKQLNGWREFAKRKKVECMNPSCRKITENLCSHREKYFCSNICGSAYRYSLKKFHMGK